MRSYKYLFGPVPSRRLGVSLGVDLVPFKTCTYNCIYCECGPTKEYTACRKEYIKIGPVLDELDDYLSSKPELDYITFSGGGEPTLNSKIGKVIKFIKEKYPEYKTALLTNGSLLYREDVIEDIKDCDLIIPSVDAVSGNIFKKINNPAKGFSAGRVIEGIKKLRLKSNAEIWIEVFIVPGLNDTKKEIGKIKKRLMAISPGLFPDKIQLNSLDRPGTKEWVKRTPPATMTRIKKELSPLNAEIIGGYKGKKKKESQEKSNLEKRILGLIKRRPCTAQDIADSFGAKKGEVSRNLRKLENCGKIKKLHKERGEFYKSNG
ncbi:MAG: radical SAM protein [Elusimicrobia bacterium]|jgi:wyosine [tRNA(Phe)-imidazoG37] synthetase (radical SAM superfamily)|nr:radical SAM protein [Elusimicrobiota bacterium]